jgi:putative NADH-flavin reductase
MNITIFGSTGSVGSECFKQALDAGHIITILIRNKTNLNIKINNSVKIIEGNVLEISDVNKVIQKNTDVVIFAIGMDKDSPPDLCTNATKNILDSMINERVKKFVFCSGASTLLQEDNLTFGMKFVEYYGKKFMSKKHYDKSHQFELLKNYNNINWYGIRPVQIVKTSKILNYKVGYIGFNPFSKISFKDCAKEMIKMMNDDKWLHKMPIIHY